MNANQGTIIVLDTSAIVAALFGARSKMILKAWRRGVLVLYYSEAIRREYQRILMKIPPIRQNSQWFLDELQTSRFAVKVKQTPVVQIPIEDPEDRKFLACAQAAKADYLVSLDAHLLNARAYHETKIVRPGELIRELKSIQ